MNFISLPYDIIYLIILELEFIDIIRLCKVNKKLNGIIKNINFWKYYIQYKLKQRINNSNNLVIWYQRKIKEYPIIKKIIYILNENKGNINITVKYTKDFDTKWNIFERLDNIYKLCFSDINIETLPYIPYIRYIYCSNTNLKFLPSYNNLEELTCSFNNLTTLPIMRNLRVLWCDNNNLKFLPSLANLEELDCCANNLISLPLYPKLTYLRCINNKLTTLPKYSNLEKLTCYCNPLPYIKLDEWKIEWDK